VEHAELVIIILVGFQPSNHKSGVVASKKFKVWK
jgi:hypothetical protein